MANILKREYAPVTDQAWQAIDEEARRVLTRNLTARSVVDFNGPHGWEFAAVNMGRVEVKAKNTGNVNWGVRHVMPLIETRVFFDLDQFETDNISRGSEDPELDPLVEAAEEAADFEDRAVFNGFKEGGIKGILASLESKPVNLSKDPSSYPGAIAAALKQLSAAGIGEPYTLLLGTDEYYSLYNAEGRGYPPYKMIGDLIGPNIQKCPALKGGLLMSTRGGDFELFVGQDFSIGYSHHDHHKIGLFITESFAFRVNDPAAAVQLKPTAK